MTIHRSDGAGSALCTLDIETILRQCISLPFSWPPASASMLLHSRFTRNIAVCEMGRSHRHLGHYWRVGWSACGQYIHGLQASKRTEPSSPSSQPNDGRECHLARFKFTATLHMAEIGQQSKAQPKAEHGHTLHLCATSQTSKWL